MDNYSPFLTRLILDIINRRDFNDYGILASNTQVFVDNEFMDITIVSPYYFEYVKKNGLSLLDDFMTDPLFTEFVNEWYQTRIEQLFNDFVADSSILIADLLPTQPEIVLVDNLNEQQVKEMRRSLYSRKNS